jgi:hypothetical protein
MNRTLFWAVCDTKHNSKKSLCPHFLNSYPASRFKYSYVTESCLWSSSDIHSCYMFFIHSFSSLSHDRSKPLSKRCLHLARSRASSFRWDYPHLSLKSFNSLLPLLPRLPVTSIPDFIFLSITCSWRQFLCKMWQIQLTFRLRISYRIFLCCLTWYLYKIEAVCFGRYSSCLRAWLPDFHPDRSLTLFSFATS